MVTKIKFFYFVISLLINLAVIILTSCFLNSFWGLAFPLLTFSVAIWCINFSKDERQEAIGFGLLWGTIVSVLGLFITLIASLFFIKMC